MEANKQAEKPKYYAVMVEGKASPSVLHNKFENAVEEAKRLAFKELKPTYILLAITKFEISEIKITELI